MVVLAIPKNQWSFTWIPDPAFYYTDRVLLQTKRFCSGYNTACLTFSRASLLRKLCNCYTVFFFKKKKRSLPKWDQMTFLPTKSMVTGGRRSNLYPPPPPLPMCDYARSCIYGGKITDVCCLCPDEAVVLTTFNLYAKYSSFFFFSVFVVLGGSCI